MKQAILLLIGSRKFVITTLALLTLGGFVITGKMPASQFFTSLEHLTGILVAAIGAEGVAEKWNAPPPSQSSSADSLRPPPAQPSSL